MLSLYVNIVTNTITYHMTPTADEDLKMQLKALGKISKWTLSWDFI